MSQVARSSVRVAALVLAVTHPTSLAAQRAGAPPRIVAVGDLHGDLAAARAALRLAGAIDAKDRWIGGGMILVQTGDVLDRGDDEPKVIALLQRLQHDAPRTGGKVWLLNGNHEYRNVAFEFGSTTAQGFKAYARFDRPTPGVPLPADVKPEQRGRAIAFMPGSAMARLFATRPTMLVLDGNVFVHGGVLPQHVARGIETMNREAAAWLRGEAPQPSWIENNQSPVWTRVYSMAPTPAACDSAQSVLKSLRARRMVVGHTIQENGITSYCNGAVWAVDVGMSAFFGGPIEVLEIRGDSVRVLGPVERKRATPKHVERRGARTRATGDARGDGRIHAGR